MASFLPDIITFWDKIDSVKYPHTNGLTDVTACELKKMQEHISNHVDKKSL